MTDLGPLVLLLLLLDVVDLVSELEGFCIEEGGLAKVDVGCVAELEALEAGLVDFGKVSVHFKF